MPIYRLENDFDINGDNFRATLRKAIEDDILTVRFDGNTHIRAFSKIPKDKILDDFDKSEYPGHICIYPHDKKLVNSEI